MNDHWTPLNSNVRSNTIRPPRGWAKPRRASPNSIYHRNRDRGRGRITSRGRGTQSRHRSQTRGRGIWRGQTRSRGRGRGRGNVWGIVPKKPQWKPVNDEHKTDAVSNNQSSPFSLPPILQSFVKPNNKSTTRTITAPSNLPPILQSMLGNNAVNNAAMQRLNDVNNDLNINQPKTKKTKKTKKNNRPKPSELNLSDFITTNIKKKKGAKRKKLPMNERVFKQEKAFKIKQELANHPYIIKMQKLKEQRIANYKKRLLKSQNPQKSENIKTTLNNKSNNNDNGDDKKVEQIKQSNDDKTTNKIKQPKRYSSQKKRVRKGRIHHDVVNVVEFLVNTVCDNSNDTKHSGLTKKTIKTRQTRQRKKEMEKLRKTQPHLIEKRNLFKDMHSGAHGTIMKYAEIRSYANHLGSTELYDRVGFLLNKLSAIQQQRYQQTIEAKAKFQHREMRKLFLCGMRECIKALKNDNVVGIIMSAQMEPLPESSGLDKMIDEIKRLCKEREIEIIYALNRKQLNFILKLKPWQGNVSCVTLLDVCMYRETWQRIIEMKRALNEQYLMLQHDFIPIFRAICVKPRYLPIYEQEEIDERERKKQRELEEEQERLREVEKKKEEEMKKKYPYKDSKLRASANTFQPTFDGWKPPNVNVPVINLHNNMAFNPFLPLGNAKNPFLAMPQPFKP